MIVQQSQLAFWILVNHTTLSDSPD